MRAMPSADALLTMKRPLLLTQYAILADMWLWPLESSKTARTKFSGAAQRSGFGRRQCKHCPDASTFMSPSSDIPWFWLVYVVLVLHTEYDRLLHLNYGPEQSSLQPALCRHSSLHHQTSAAAYPVKACNYSSSVHDRLVIKLDSK